MVDGGELRKGLIIEIDGNLYYILEYRHLKLANRPAQIRLRLRDIKAGHTIERTFQGEVRFKVARVEERPAQYLYREGNFLHFMDKETFEEVILSEEEVGEEAMKYLKEGEDVFISVYDGKPIGMELPHVVELEVVDTGPGFKGDTAQSGGKPATLETGITIQVPFFVQVGDKVRVDTRTGKYIERVEKA